MIVLNLHPKTAWGRKVAASLESARNRLERDCSCPGDVCLVTLRELEGNRYDVVVTRPRPVLDRDDWKPVASPYGRYRKVFEKDSAREICGSVGRLLRAPLVDLVEPSGSAIEWHPSYSVGVRQLDEQHQVILALINRLASAGRLDVHSEVISEVLEALTRYANDHFRSEEELLARHGYAGVGEQKEDHTQYRLKVARLCLDASRHKTSLPEELTAFLRDWWVRHILERDMKFRPFLSGSV